MALAGGRVGYLLSPVPTTASASGWVCDPFMRARFCGVMRRFTICAHLTFLTTIPPPITSLLCHMLGYPLKAGQWGVGHGI